MNKTEIQNSVEDLLNDKILELKIDFDNASKAKDRFLLHTVKRLYRAYILFKYNKAYYEDFLLALRDYMLIFDTKIRLENDLIGADKYGISKDVQTKTYFSTYQLPNYINPDFVKQVFTGDADLYEDESQKYNLNTDPLIYQITGFSRFKTLSQKLSVYGALNTPPGYTTLVSLPTGGGKSLITQAIAYQSKGLTIVVVPTVSLAIDQVRTAKNNIRTENADKEIFAYHNGIDSKPILDAIKSKTARLLFISPEALINNQNFDNVIKSTNADKYLKNIIVDEAHIVVDWGASFRVDYQCLEPWRLKLMLTNSNIRTILLSATFEQRTINILKAMFSRDDKWIEIRCDSLRHEPRYTLVKTKSNKDKNEKLLELVRKLPHPMIIYTARPEDAENLKGFLAVKGINNVKTFTGLTNSAKRKALIDSWVNDEFEIMAATSAFGIGVDKNDVRTVIHAYVPPNPNTYYQELGRGGRDKMPSLSVMCVQPSDLDISFNRINKKVLTTEKIIGRWKSMYTSKRSLRKDNLVYIDTTIKPDYNTIDEFDDSPISDADQNWNIYVILLLRRYNLLKINEIEVQNGNYVFVVEILSDILRIFDQAQNDYIEKIRAEEWNYFKSSYNLMRNAIKHSNDRCWSEMFFETYDKVSEYCGGCGTHKEADESDFYDFPLKVPIKAPIKSIGEDQLEIFGTANEIVIFAKGAEKDRVLKALIKKQLSVLISPKSMEDFIHCLNLQASMMIIGPTELRALMQKSNFYFLSGLIAVIYDGSENEILKQLRLVNKYLSGAANIKLIHILPENVYFSEYDKMFTDFIDGPVISSTALLG